MDLLDFDKMTTKSVGKRILNCFFQNIPDNMIKGFETSNSIIIGITYLDDPNDPLNNFIFCIEIYRNGNFKITNYLDVYIEHEKYKNIQPVRNYLQFYELLLTFKING